MSILSDFMEGVDEKDYCPNCGELLHQTITLPDATKRLVAHVIDSSDCKEIRASNEKLINSDNQ